MRKKQFITAIILLVFLAIISFLSREKDLTGDFKVGNKVFAGVDPASISKITFSKKEYKTILVKKGNEWVVSNRYEVTADPALIRQFLDLLNSAKAVHVVPHQVEDLPLFQLDDKLGLKVDIETSAGSVKTFYFGKSHTFSAKSSGRYVYLPSSKAVILLDKPLLYISPLPRIWLKKYLPFHEDVAAATLYSDSNIIWKTERQNIQTPFRMVLPKASEKSPQEIKQLMSFVMQLRYMDIVPAENDFTPDSNLKKVSLGFQTYDGKIYSLDFLKLVGNQIRCSLKLIANSGQSEFVNNYVDTDLLKEELSEWHFMIPAAFYEVLLK